MQREIPIAAALIVRDSGDTLLVRKRGNPEFMQAGGRIEGVETPKMTLARRLKAELGIDISPWRMMPFGCFEAEAVDVPGDLLVAHVFRVQLEDDAIVPTAEIDEARWMPLCAVPSLPLAPLTRNHILTLFWQMHFGVDLPYRHDACTLSA